jgi:hypothetical protein
LPLTSRMTVAAGRPRCPNIETSGNRS